jgi:very-short-patch-repair endonuclease
MREYIDKYRHLPYNPSLRERAKELRKAGNLSEILMWRQFRNKNFKGYDFDRQKIIGNFIVDFFCINCGAVIEVDGSSHDDKLEYDRERDEFIRGLGLEIIHIRAAEVLKCMGDVMAMLQDHPALRAPLQGGELI